MKVRVSRLAPSPTGALHLGNARTFVINWALARREGWRLVLRIEDLDGPRVKAGATRAMIDTLEWLGLDYDGAPLRQSDDLEPYRASMAELASRGLVYACRLTRREIEQAASAPHGDAHDRHFPAALRPAAPSRAFIDDDANYRLIVADETIVIDDAVAGRFEHNVARTVGDFALWTRRGTPAYQLAVVVDDARQGVTDVVRGDDLLPSAARQTLVYRAFGLAPPRWWHLPLVLGPDGLRLAKRHGDTRLASYREVGVTAERLIGLLAAWCGVPGERRPMTAADFRDAFDPTRLGRDPVTFTEDDHAWLLAGS